MAHKSPRAASYSRQLESHGVFGEKTLGGSERTHDVLLIVPVSVAAAVLRGVVVDLMRSLHRPKM